MKTKRKFEEIKIEWDGVEYTIPRNKVMGVIADVEDYVTLKELYDYTQNPGSAKFAKLAMAYAAMLTSAGVKEVDSEEVYINMVGASADEITVMFSAIAGLLALMVPHQDLAEKVTAGSAPGSADEQSTGGKSEPTAAR